VLNFRFSPLFIGVCLLKKKNYDCLENQNIQIRLGFIPKNLNLIGLDLSSSYLGLIYNLRQLAFPLGDVNSISNVSISNSKYN